MRRVNVDEKFEECNLKSDRKKNYSKEKEREKKNKT